MADMKSRHAFGSEQNVDIAIENGLIDAYDVLFLDEGKIGWITKTGEKMILEDKEQVAVVTVLPEFGNSDVLYICNNKLYLWNGVDDYNSISGESGIDESAVDAKIATAKQEIADEIKTYTDEQIAENINSTSVVEF
jgi:hypothetical protein